MDYESVSFQENLALEPLRKGRLKLSLGQIMKPHSTKFVCYDNSKLIACILVAVSFVFCGQLIAQELRINGEWQCDFSPEGNVYVTADGSVNIYDDCEVGQLEDLKVHWVKLNPKNAQSGSQIEVLWNSSGAEYCQPFSTGGSQMNDWTDKELDHPDVPTFFTAPTSEGEYQVGVRCYDGDGYSAQNEESLYISEETLPVPEITQFDVTPSTVEPGSNLNVSWNSINTDSCQASGNLPGWSGNKDTSGNGFEVTIPSSAIDGKEYSLKLQCAGNGQSSASKTKKVTVQVNDAPAGCDGRTITSLNRDMKPSVDYNGTNWEDVFLYWPGTSQQTPIRINRNHYAAIKFTAESPIRSDASISISMNGASYHHGPSGPMLMTISTCPGDFNKVAIEADPDLSGSCFDTPRLGYQEEQFVNRCIVQENKTYYMNIVPVDTLNSSPEKNSDINWYCKDDNQGSNCGVDIVLTKKANGWPEQ